MSALGGSVEYTIAYKSTSTTVSGALMRGLPSGADGDIDEAFAFHVDSEAGFLRYEGRFGGTNKRHMRIHLEGTISTSFSVEDVETLRFVQGENSGSNNGLVVSVAGTPAAGRRIRAQTSSNLNASTPSWATANSDDNTCIGDAGVACTGNTGIVATDNKFFFVDGSGFVSAKTWFTSNLDLSTVSSTVDLDDIWN